MAAGLGSGPSRNWAVFHRKPLGRKALTVGLYGWARVRPTRRRDELPCLQRGYVFRAGPIGHAQVQWYRASSGQGRVPRRSWQVSWWGVRGRRRKRYVELVVGRPRYSSRRT